MMVDYLEIAGESLRNRRPDSPEACHAYRLGRVLHLHFRSSGCQYGRCLACDYGRSSKALTAADVAEAFAVHYEPYRDEIEVLLLGSLGSLLDEREVLPSMLECILEHAYHSSVRTVIIETSWGTVTESAVSAVMGRLLGKEVFFECGLESSSEAVRRICYGKAVSDGDIAAALKAAHDVDAKMIANIMLGAPFLNREERLSDAFQSVLDAFGSGVDEVTVFPVNVKPYTAVRRLFDSGEYEQPSCEDLLRLLAALPPRILGKVSIAWWGNRQGSYSLPDIPPVPHGAAGSFDDAFISYMLARSASERRRVLERALVTLPSCESPFQAVRVTDGEVLRERRADAVARAETAPFGRNLVWIGPRESDIDAVDAPFKASSTVFGSDACGNRSYCGRIGRRANHDDVTQDQIDTMAQDQAVLAQEHPEARFVPYNPYYAFGGDRSVLEREVCLNEKALLDLFCDKTRFRAFAQEHVPVPESAVVDAAMCNAESIRRAFPRWASFIVQRGISSGGYETYLVGSGEEVPGHLLCLDEKLLVSEYVKPNVPVNVHFVVFDECCVMLPASVQLIVGQAAKLVYGGCDYACYRDIPAGARGAFERHARVLADAVRRSGYRGVLGFDAVVRGDEVFFLEMNARFQASTHALNRALKDAGLPSVHELHLESFSRALPSVPMERLERLRVDYSSIAYHSSGSLEGDALVEHVRRRIADCPSAMLFEDGEAFCDREPGAYLFSVVYPSRVSSLNVPDAVTVDQNVMPDSGCRFDAVSIEAGFMDLKIALLNQGARIAASACSLASEGGGFRVGVNGSIDLVVSGRVVNVPVEKPYVELSPFELRAEQGKLALFWLDEFVSDVEFYHRVGLEEETTSSGARIGSICFLAADRVRIQHHDRCDFACSGKGCRFCDFPRRPSGFDGKDVLEAVDRYLDSGIEFRHFLIGGGTDSSPSACEGVARIASHIRSRGCDKPIYYMDIPPTSEPYLVMLKDAGVTEVGFNIELFNRDIARRLMPAKGRIPLEAYFEALERSVEIWGSPGAVRSALVVGLEPMESTLRGVEALAQRGVSPILSAFRPARCSCMADYVSPRNRFLEEVHRRSIEICGNYGVELGPSCRQCRNNVLAE